MQPLNVQTGARNGWSDVRRAATIARQLLVRAGWAPASVLVLHAVDGSLPYRVALDIAHHTLGGAAIAYFLLCAVRLAWPRLRGALPWALAFTSACTVAVFWEFAEFAGDHLRDAHVQRSLDETMRDLVCGVFGAAATLCLLAACRRVVNP